MQIWELHSTSHGLLKKLLKDSILWIWYEMEKNDKKLFIKLAFSLNSAST